MSKILIADDCRDLREILTEFFADHHVIQAHNGEEAMRLAASHLPDIIILDVAMPVMGGLEACSRIKQDPVLGATPVVMLTGQGTMSQVEAALECRADWYFTKPFAPKWFVQRIEHLIERWKKPRPVAAIPLEAGIN